MKTFIAVLMAGLLAAGVTAWVAEMTFAAEPSEHSVVQILNVFLSFPGMEFISLTRGKIALPIYTKEMKHWTIFFNGVGGSLLCLTLAVLVRYFRPNPRPPVAAARGAL